MRILFFAAVLWVSACATNTHEPVQEGAKKDDWVAVNLPLDVVFDREQVTSGECGDNQRLQCSTQLGEAACTCVFKHSTAVTLIDLFGPSAATNSAIGL